jgi:hypothetical protein
MLKGIKQVDIEGQIGDAQGRVDPVYGWAPDYLARTLRVLDVHPEENFDQEVETAAGKTPQACLRLMQNRAWEPTRADHTVRIIDELDQLMKSARRSGPVGVDIPNDIRARSKFEALDERAAFADRFRKIQSPDTRVLACHAPYHTQSIIAATVQHYHQLKLTAIPLLEITGILAQHRFDPALFIVSRYE